MEYKGKQFDAIIATPGCGKSFICDKYPDRFVDVDELRLRLKYEIPENLSREELESTKGDRPFSRKMSTAEYVKVLEKLLDEAVSQQKILIAAPHQEAFDYFQSRDMSFAFVYPREDMKAVLTQRYKDRGNTEKFISEQENLFGYFVESNKKENRAKVKYAFGKDEFLLDIMKKFGVEFD